MSREKLKTEIRQEQIVEMALTLVASHGMEGLRVAQIAHGIGLVPSAIYRHFKGKEEVLDAVLNLIRKRLIKNVEAVCEETADPMERLHKLILRHVQLIRDNRAIPRAVPQIVFSHEAHSGSARRRSHLYKIIKEYLERVSGIIQQGQKEARIRADMDPQVLSVMLLGLIQQSAILWHVSDGRFNVTKHVEKAWQIFKQAISTPENVNNCLFMEPRR